MAAAPGWLLLLLWTMERPAGRGWSKQPVNFPKVCRGRNGIVLIHGTTSPLEKQAMATKQKKPPQQFLGTPDRFVYLAPRSMLMCNQACPAAALKSRAPLSQLESGLTVLHEHKTSLTHCKMNYLIPRGHHQQCGSTKPLQKWKEFRLLRLSALTLPAQTIRKTYLSKQTNESWSSAIPSSRENLILKPMGLISGLPPKSRCPC